MVAISSSPTRLFRQQYGKEARMKAGGIARRIRNGAMIVVLFLSWSAVEGRAEDACASSCPTVGAVMCVTDEFCTSSQDNPCDASTIPQTCLDTCIYEMECTGLSCSGSQEGSKRLECKKIGPKPPEN